MVALNPASNTPPLSAKVLTFSNGWQSESGHIFTIGWLIYKWGALYNAWSRDGGVSCQW